MLKSPPPDDAALDARLRDEAQRDRPAFDEALHARVMEALPLSLRERVGVRGRPAITDVRGHGGAPSPVAAPGSDSDTLSQRERGLHWPRYALAATVVLALSLVAVVGSGYLRQRVEQRELRRHAMASLAGAFDAAWRNSPPRVLDSAEAMATGQWSKLDQDVRREADGVRGHWAWGLLLNGQVPEPPHVPESPEPSEKNRDPRPPAGI